MDITEFCARLAIDPNLHARFLADPAAVATELGLPNQTYREFVAGNRERSRTLFGVAGTSLDAPQVLTNPITVS